jgi:hypothetical protein
MEVDGSGKHPKPTTDLETVVANEVKYVVL